MYNTDGAFERQLTGVRITDHSRYDSGGQKSIESPEFNTVVVQIRAETVLKLPDFRACFCLISSWHELRIDRSREFSKMLYMRQLHIIK